MTQRDALCCTCGKFDRHLPTERCSVATRINGNVAARRPWNRAIAYDWPVVDSEKCAVSIVRGTADASGDISVLRLAGPPDEVADYLVGLADAVRIAAGLDPLVVVDDAERQDALLAWLSEVPQRDVLAGLVEYLVELRSQRAQAS